MIRETFEQLDFNIILDMIKENSLSSWGRDLLVPSCVTNDINIIETRRKEIEEILFKDEASEIKLRHFPSFDEIFDQNIPYYEGLSIYNVGEFLYSLKLLSEYNKDEVYITEAEELRNSIDIAIDNEGEVKETHPLIAPLLVKLERIKKKRASFSTSFLQDNAQYTNNLNPIYRNERVVLSIKSGNKSEFKKSYIQGSSKSGETLYIEPFALIELNNDVLLAAEQIKVVKRKIIFDLSSKIRDFKKYLLKSIKYVTSFDFHYSLAMFIKKTKCNQIAIGDKIELKKVRHPLLFDKVVPLDIIFDIKALIISGANAGGKTVAMKSIGLCALLNQMSGYAPVDKNSTIKLYDSIYTDIGDGQSILEHYSTFSSHMKTLANIINVSGENSLVLLDEIGSSTDPKEGSALTISILNYLTNKVSTVVATSHFSEVKLYAYNSDNMLNASMEFDSNNNRPTYKLLTGLPGHSHALEIAKAMGVPEEIINNAMVGSKADGNITKLIRDLNNKNIEIENKIKDLDIEKIKVKQELKILSKQKKELEAIKFDLKVNNNDELSKFIKQSRKDLERLVNDLKTGKLEKEDIKKTKGFINKLEVVNKKHTDEIKKVEDSYVSDYEYKVGDKVLCGSIKKTGILLSKVGNAKWKVELSNMKLVLHEDEFSPDDRKVEEVKTNTFKSEIKKPKWELDLRGKRAEQALELLQEQIESAMLSNLSSFSIIHGYGTGVLSQVIHKYLKSLPFVKEYYFAHPEDGGMGKTYVIL